MIRRPDEFHEDFEISADVVVIGAGPGGAAAAYKLAQKGRRVVILEMGGYYTPTDFSRDGHMALKNLYQDSGQRFTHGNAYFATMFGKGVGGGTLINSAISFRPPERVIKEWAHEAQLQNFSMAALKPHLDEVEKNVNIEVLEVGKLGRNNTVFKDGLEKLKFKGGVVPRSTKGCNGCGICFYGCPSGAKQSVDKNFIAKALSYGVDVYTYARAARIDVDSKTKRFQSLMAVLIDPITNLKRVQMTVKAKHLVLAAGAIGTPQLLIRDKLANSSGEVGRNFRCHPSTGVVAQFDFDIFPSRNVVQGYYSDEFFDRDILLETFSAPAGIVATMIPGVGLELINRMKEYRKFAGAGAMIREQGSGVLSFDNSKVAIEYHTTQKDQELLTEGLYRSAEVLFAAGANTVYADNPVKGTFHSQGELSDFYSQNKNLGNDIIREGNHGLGTCRMGENSKTSVVNSFGRSHDIPNLSILDVSQFPSALGVNPQITIMALALRGAEYLDGNFS